MAMSDVRTMVLEHDGPQISGLIGQQVRVPKTAELVAAHLRRRIVRGELTEGDALPPEAMLMEQFGVSRPTLREAFRVLESEALISVRRGAHGGARVHVPNGDVAARYAALVLEYRGTDLADIHTARAIIEPPCARLLAERHAPEDVTVLRDAVAAAEAAEGNPTRFATLTMRFHALLVDRAGNHTLSVLAGMLRHIIDLANVEHAAADQAAALRRRGSRRALRVHAEVVDLIEAGNAEGAEALWREHLADEATTLAPGTATRTLLDLLG
jgi:DNA-binding FadR family transcriptional regulator